MVKPQEYFNELIIKKAQKSIEGIKGDITAVHCIK